MQKLSLIILGAAGYMGSTAVKCLPKLKAEFSRIVIDQENLLLVDPYFGKDTDGRARRLSEFENVLGFAPSTVTNMQFVYPYVWGVHVANSQQPILFYDASPNEFHYGHLIEIAGYNAPNVYYLGEKPIILDLQELYAARKAPDTFEFYCELIETENPVFKKTREYIQSEQLEVTKIWMWRAGPSAMKKIFGQDRPGVMGGAVEDKALHDFSITLGLLGGINAVKKISESKMKFSGESYLCPTQRAVFEGIPSFVGMSNTDIFKPWSIDCDENGFHRSRFPADSFARLDCQWDLGARTVSATYLFSWAGMLGTQDENELSEVWKQHFGMKLPVGRQPIVGDGLAAAHTTTLEEVRIAILRCTDQNGCEKWICCNFLAKSIYRDVSRFSKVYDNQKRLLGNLYEDSSNGGSEIKTENLADVLIKVLKACFDRTKLDDIGKPATLFVHELLLHTQRQRREAIRKRLEQTGASWWDEAYEQSLNLIKQKIKSANRMMD